MVSLAKNASIAWIYYTNLTPRLQYSAQSYTFTVSPGFGNVQINMIDRGGSGSSFNPDFEVSRNGSVLRNTNFVFGRNQILDFKDLEPGNYTITVYLQENSAPQTLRDWQTNVNRYQWKYDLDVYAYPSSPPVDNAGNTLSAARPITLGSTATSYTDWVGSTDVDYYRFSLSNTSNFNLSLTGLTSDADVQLLDSNGRNLASSTNRGITPERITGQLTAGDYYIRVFSYSGSTNYNLSVSTKPNLYLIGDNTDNVLTGGAGNDTLVGLGGNDTLTGGAGSDLFIFNTPTEGIDRITDFNVIDDTIVVSAAKFGGRLVPGAAIMSNQFVIGSSATTGVHRFIYNSRTGGLFFDADGNGALASTQIATLNPNLALTHQDIYVA
jgi:hypothetical protein